MVIGSLAITSNVIGNWQLLIAPSLVLYGVLAEEEFHLHTSTVVVRFCVSLFSELLQSSEPFYGDRQVLKNQDPTAIFFNSFNFKSIVLWSF